MPRTWWESGKAFGGGTTESVRTLFDKAGRCSLTPSWPRLDCAWFQRLKLRYDVALSNFAFDFDLRRFDKAGRCADKQYVFTIDARHPGRAALVDPGLKIALGFSN